MKTQIWIAVSVYLLVPIVRKRLGLEATHLEPLTLFLRKARAPLDDNIVERPLKKAILHRKNSLFYRTRKGACMGGLFLSLIHTAELCGANAFDYLTELQRHAEDLKQNPSQ